jgi:hypothetical protein
MSAVLPAVAIPVARKSKGSNLRNLSDPNIAQTILWLRLGAYRLAKPQPLNAFPLQQPVLMHSA